MPARATWGRKVVDVVQGMRAALMIVCLVVFALVFAVMLYSIWRHHRSGAQGRTNFHGSVAVEICWAVAPFVIVALLVWPAARVFWAR